MKYIITDIDHTVADAAWRDPLLGRWDEYYLAGKDDEPIFFVVDMLRVLSLVANYTVVAVTGRPEKWRSLTTDWLIKNDVPVEQLYMRAENDYRSSNIVKTEAVKSRFDLRDIAFVLEDRERDAAAYRELGLSVLVVSKGSIPWQGPSGL